MLRTKPIIKRITQLFLLFRDVRINVMMNGTGTNTAEREPSVII